MITIPLWQILYIVVTIFQSLQYLYFIHCLGRKQRSLVSGRDGTKHSQVKVEGDIRRHHSHHSIDTHSSMSIIRDISSETFACEETPQEEVSHNIITIHHQISQEPFVSA